MTFYILHPHLSSSVSSWMKWSTSIKTHNMFISNNLYLYQKGRKEASRVMCRTLSLRSTPWLSGLHSVRFSPCKLFVLPRSSWRKCFFTRSISAFSHSQGIQSICSMILKSLLPVLHYSWAQTLTKVFFFFLDFGNK